MAPKGFNCCLHSLLIILFAEKDFFFFGLYIVFGLGNNALLWNKLKTY